MPDVDVESLPPVDDVDVEADVARVGEAPHGVSLTDAERAAIAAQLTSSPDRPS